MLYSQEYRFKSLETMPDGSRKIKGCPNDTNEFDRWDENVTLSAMIAAWPEYSKNPVILFNHDMDKSVGLIKSFTIENNLPMVEGEIAGHKADIIKDIDAGLITCLSIRFRAKKWTDGRDGRRQFEEIEWIETSLTPIGMNRGSRFSVSKSLAIFDDTKYFKDIEEKLLGADEKLKSINLDRDKYKKLSEELDRKVYDKDKALLTQEKSLFDRDKKLAEMQAMYNLCEKIKELETTINKMMR